MEKRSTLARAGILIVTLVIIATWHFAARLWWSTDQSLYDGNGTLAGRTIWNYNTDLWGIAVSHVCGVAHLIHWALAIGCILGVVALIAALSYPNGTYTARDTVRRATAAQSQIRTNIRWGTREEFNARVEEWRKREEQG
jgi:hypothetical protein